MLRGVVAPYAPTVRAVADPAGGPAAVGPVLVVDDDASIRSFVADAVALAGYATHQAADGAQALAALAGGLRPCLVLLDMRMPVLDGWAFARRYAELPGPRAPVVVMTAERDARAAAAEIAADGVLPKPFDLEDLDALLARHCP